MASGVSVSVVLPVLNEARDLPPLLEQLRAQTPPPGGFEVLVVDGGSTDGTRERVAEAAADWPGLRLLDNPRRRSSAARNIGAREAGGRYVLYVDGHCVLPRRDYLVRLLEVFESTDAGCLCRPQPLHGLAEGPWARAVAQARHSPVGHKPGSDIYGGEPRETEPHSAGAAYRRDLVESLGGFDERFDACEDVEFNHRVSLSGVRSFLHPDLAVEYRPRSSVRGLFRQMLRYGRGRSRLMIRHPSVVPWMLLAPTLLLVGWLVLAVAAPAAALRVAAAALALWALVVAVEGIRLGGASLQAGRVAAALAAVHAGLFLGFWRGCLEFRRFRPDLVRPGAPGVLEDNHVYP